MHNFAPTRARVRSALLFPLPKHHSAASPFFKANKRITDRQKTTAITSSRPQHVQYITKETHLQAQEKLLHRAEGSRAAKSAPSEGWRARRKTCGNVYLYYNLNIYSLACAVLLFVLFTIISKIMFVFSQIVAFISVCFACASQNLHNHFKKSFKMAP